MRLQTVYKQTKTGATQEWTVEVEGNRYRTISGQTDGKKTISEWTTVYGKNTGRANATTDEEQALKEAESKRKLKLEKDYHETISDIGTKRHFEPMLASKWEDYKDTIKYPIYSQPKLDGIRCIVNKDGMWSRNGKPIISAPHIYDSLKPLFDENEYLVFDGELYADKFANDFNKIVSLVKKTKPTAEDLKESKKNIQYWIYDLPHSLEDIDSGFSIRYKELSDLFTKWSYFKAHCVLVDTDICKNETEVMKLYEQYVNDGYEGQILRVDGWYENKRSKNLLKHKSFIDEEYIIKDICEGEGNRAGTAGYFVFETKDGKPFKSNVKGTWEETAEMLKNKNKLIGKEATIKYFNLTPDGIPRFPYVINIDRSSYE
jgi:ATP-dependent DNA ligase